MIVTKLEAKNFMPFRGDMKVEFATDPNANVTIFFGENMRGKTSLLNAIRWALYGKAIGRHSQEISLFNLFNSEAASEGDWNMHVSLSFEHQGVKYQMIRTATKDEGSLVRPERLDKFNVERQLFKNGELLHNNLVDSEINRIVPEQISRFFLFDGELLDEYENLLIDGSEQSKRIKEAIEQVLGVPTLINGKDDSYTIYKMAQNQQGKDLRKVDALKGLAETLAKLRAESEVVESSYNKLKDSLFDTQQDIDENEEFLKKTEVYAKYRERLSNQKEKLAEIHVRREQLNRERLECIKDAWREVLKPSLLTKRERVFEDLQKIETTKSQKQSIVHKLKDLEANINKEVCCTCGHKLSVVQIAEMNGEIQELNNQLSHLKVDSKQMDDLVEDTRALDKLLSATKASGLSLIDRDIAQTRVDSTKIQRIITDLEGELVGQDTDKIARKRKELKALTVQLGVIRGQLNSEKEKLDKVNRDIETTARLIDSKPQAKPFKSTELAKLSGQLNKIYSAAINELRDELKITVQKYATDAFKQLTSQKKYARLKINENYGLTIVDENGDDVAVRSAGAEQIVAMSLIDGLAHASRSAGPLIMDTPFGRLDKTHRSNILEYLPTTTPQLVLLVHGGEIDYETDLEIIKSRIGAIYMIEEVTSRHSKIVKEI